ncbi:PPC domain-containing DNA-binding protein [uncultured Azohydromonas sp.]|jgi:Predicted DNA-binding protein with PD1-like DNA-binding motif|uniref:PPC domain-containing DNA-binding protein n=1 Tax=uncultured Azohydromonas sp. TaxID=487342 RepID=UPI00261642CA|nr:PPC domain-containing DNA-binding protein [uncultured Azohydromonas sp.]
MTLTRMLKALRCSLFAFALPGLHAGAASAQDLDAKYIRTPTGYLMVLRNGDNVLAHLERLALAEKIPSASFVGIGFMREATFGFYDFGRKAFNPRTFNDVELAHMTGTIAWKEGKPSIHAHGIVTDGSFASHGGHLLGLTVGTGSSEITVVLHPHRLERFVDPQIGANVLGLPGHP